MNSVSAGRSKWKLEVPPTTAWQPDRLAQRELYDEKTRPHVPKYDSILSGEKVSSRLHVRPEGSSRSARAVVASSNDDTRLCESLEKPVPRSGCGLSSHGELLLRGETGRRAVNTTLPRWPRHRWAVLLPVHNLCTLLGLANSHDTTVVVLQSVLEEHEEAVNNNLQYLWNQKYVTSNRKNKTSPDAKDQQSMVRLGRNIGQVIRNFSGYEEVHVAAEVVPKVAADTRNHSSSHPSN
ncbi:hypothetical protein ABBQ38_006257 [Trebouxia sp. C0009 RCD-2024]